MAVPVIAMAWERTGDDRAMLVSAGYLIRLLQVSIHFGAAWIADLTMRALCRFNLATLTSACDSTELLDLIKAALAFCGASAHKKLQFADRRTKLEGTGTDPARGNSRTCSPQAAGFRR